MPCNFCEFSSTRYGYGSRSEQRPQEQDSDAELLKEVERLRLLIKRMTGKEDGMIFTELEALQSKLKDVQLIVRDLKKKTKLEEDESQLHQNKEAEDHGTKRRVPAPCSSRGRPEKQDGGTPLVRAYCFSGLCCSFSVSVSSAASSSSTIATDSEPFSRPLLSNQRDSSSSDALSSLQPS